MTEKQRLFILYDWFYPGFKAGGPIQSLTNLTVALTAYFDIYVLTGAKDLHSKEFYEGVEINNWNPVNLPQSKASIHIYYAEKDKLDKKLFKFLFEQVNPAVIYFNGIFSYKFFLLPLMQLKKIAGEVRIVVCPRGMLKEGALSGKAFKKKLYLGYIKNSGLLKTAHWHATTSDEVENINKIFSNNQGVRVAPNIPKTPFFTIQPLAKQPGELKLVYLSLINEHKNLLLLLQVMMRLKEKITLDIYGPVIDEAYWNKCKVLIQQMPARISYNGLVEPGNVQGVLQQYHGLVLFTKGENFGHAIYECLSVGRPVITTHFTPWQNLFEQRAGANIDLENLDECINKINCFAGLNQEDYNTFCFSASAMAKKHFNSLNAESLYLQLFSTTPPHS